MPHQRSRDILTILLKRIRLWPVIGLIGARQTGKSVLLRELFQPEVRERYVSLDAKVQRDRAQSSPDAFSEIGRKGRMLIVDEIQKAPDLFDALKLRVDENRRPGMYVISGSTEFSKMTGIRESLTGRIGILHLYPLTLGELCGRPTGRYFARKIAARAHITLADFDRKMVRGGMPGMCFLRSDAEYRAACDMWLETTCYRDLAQVKGKGFDGALATDILTTLARAPEPTVTAVARELRRDSRMIQRYLDAFEVILVLIKLAPHPAGVGKPHYLFCDVGLAGHMGAARDTLLRTHLLHEALAVLENGGLGRPQLKYYRNAKTSRVPLVLEWSRVRGSPQGLAIHFFDGEGAAAREISALKAFSARLSGPLRLLLLTHTGETYFERVASPAREIEVHPLRG